MEVFANAIVNKEAADFVVAIQEGDDDGRGEVDDLDAALDGDPKVFERLLDDAIVTNGREPDSVDLQITLDLTALCKAIELRAEKGRGLRQTVPNVTIIL